VHGPFPRLFNPEYRSSFPDDLKQTRYLWLSHPDKLTPAKKEKLATIQAMNTVALARHIGNGNRLSDEAQPPGTLDLARPSVRKRAPGCLVPLDSGQRHRRFHEETGPNDPVACDRDAVALARRTWLISRIV